MPPPPGVDRAGMAARPLVIDDQALVVHVRGRGLVVVTGCGHAGAVNIVRHAQRLTGIDRLHGLLAVYTWAGPGVELINPTVAALADPTSAAGPATVPAAAPARPRRRPAHRWASRQQRNDLRLDGRPACGIKDAQRGSSRTGRRRRAGAPAVAVERRRTTAGTGRARAKRSGRRAARSGRTRQPGLRHHRRGSSSSRDELEDDSGPSRDRTQRNDLEIKGAGTRHSATPQRSLRNRPCGCRELCRGV